MPKDPAVVMDAAALTVKLETTGGAKRKLTTMQGVDALADWLRAAA
jgi:hypothetical protein